MKLIHILQDQSVQKVNLKLQRQSSLETIIRNGYGNAITKSVRHRKHVVVKHFSGRKINDLKHYAKPTQ